LRKKLREEKEGRKKNRPPFRLSVLIGDFILKKRHRVSAHHRGEENSKKPFVKRTSKPPQYSNTPTGILRETFMCRGGRTERRKNVEERAFYR